MSFVDKKDTPNFAMLYNAHSVSITAFIGVAKCNL